MKPGDIEWEHNHGVFRGFESRTEPIRFEGTIRSCARLALEVAVMLVRLSCYGMSFQHRFNVVPRQD